MMNTEMYLSLNANGTLHQSGNDGTVPPTVLADFASHVARSGALAIGRTTFDLIRASGALSQLSAIGSSLFVLTTQDLEVEGATPAPTPRQAVERAREADHRQLLIAGGAKTYDAFLRAGLVNALTLNVLPALEEEGLRLQVDANNELTLDDHIELEDGVVQLRYTITSP